MTSAWWTRRSIMAAGTTAAANTSPQRPHGFFVVAGHDEGSSFVAAGDQLEEQVRCLRFERDVADLIDDQHGDAGEFGQLVLEFAGGVGVGKAGDPFGRGGERDAVAG